MNRRALLKAGGLAMAGFAWPACRTGNGGSVSTGPQRPQLHLAVPRLSWDRVLRTTVGLRPHRDNGFVLRAEKLDAKTIIHNYGHGGAGMSIGWGCGIVVAELAAQTGERRVAVIGCGSPGLTAARQLQQRGFDVTIYAKTVPPDTTSNMSLAGFTPTTALINKGQAHRRLGFAVRPHHRAVVPATAVDGQPGVRRLLDGRVQRQRYADTAAGRRSRRRRGGGDRIGTAAGIPASRTRP
jgi:glycine/D-amino acid oxidase-like deaminating enzyme